jgi:hypothetical protein
MAIQAGTYKLGPDNASLREETLKVGDNSGLALSADPTSLRVREGKGGMQALTDDDKEDIHKTIDKDVLKKKDISFASSSVESAGDGLSVSGDLELGGKSKPVTFELSESGGTLTGTAPINQSDWGIKPYSAMFGALKVDDEIRVVVEAKLG